MRTQYKEQGNRLYKITEVQITEIDLENYPDQISVIWAYRNFVSIHPNKYAKRIKKTLFEKYLKEFNNKIS